MKKWRNRWVNKANEVDEKTRGWPEESTNIFGMKYTQNSLILLGNIRKYYLKQFVNSGQVDSGQMLWCQTCL